MTLSAGRFLGPTLAAKIPIFLHYLRGVGEMAPFSMGTVDGWNLKQPPGMYKTPQNNGINYQLQLVSRISAINSRKYIDSSKGPPIFQPEKRPGLAEKGKSENRSGFCRGYWYCSTHSIKPTLPWKISQFDGMYQERCWFAILQVCIHISTISILSNPFP